MRLGWPRLRVATSIRVASARSSPSSTAPLGDPVYELALFAGAGGGLLGSSLLGWRTVCAVEVEPFCREILLRRQRDGLLDLFPVWDDVRTFAGRPWRGAVDVVTAGFPCQPFSVAGAMRGADDDRNLWPETARILGEVRPRYAFLENVPGLLTSGYFDTVLGDLDALGFDATWDCLPASAIGAPHRRDRLWIVAHAERARLEEQQREPRDNGAECSASERGSDRGEGWATEPNVGRVAHGVAHRVDRIRALGNGQVPRVVAEAWRRLRCRGSR